MADFELDPSIAEDPVLVRELWYHEAAQFRDAAGDGELRLNHLDHCDALLDAYARLRSVGRVAVDS